MALYQVANGGTVNAADVNQYYNLLTGATTDQPVTIANRLRTTNTGASTACGFMGGTAGGAPASGTFAAGDMVIDAVYGGAWYCTTGGTPGTWQPTTMPISAQTLGSAVSSVTFSSIPAGFGSLRIVLVGQSTATGNGIDVAMQFNGDTGANYSSQTWDGVSSSGTLSATYATAGTTMQYVGLVPGTSLNTSRVGSTNVFIPRYTSNLTKIAHSDAYVTDGGAAAYSRHRWGHWVNTAAITSITVICGAGNFAIGTFIGLYGTPC